MKYLYLPLKSEYFNDIKIGIKKEEYRLYNEYWIKRLVNREYDRIAFTLGYPKKNDLDKRLEFNYNGYEIKEITHKHFGNIPTKVFAIKIYEQ